MKKLLIGSIALGLAAASQAAWTLIDDFDSYDNSVSTATTAASGGVWDGVFEGTGNANIVDDAGANQVLKTSGGAAWRGNTTDLAQWGAGTAIGATSTYFYQFRASSTGGSFDVMMGLSAEQANVDTSNAWSDFAVMPFLVGAGDGTADFKMSNAGLVNDEILTDVNLDEWYNIWLVVDNNNEQYSVYTSQGENDGVFGGTATQYRNGFTGTALNALGFMAGGGAGSAVDVDNVYFTSGVDTTYAIPEPATIGLIGMFGAGMLVVRRRFMI